MRRGLGLTLAAGALLLAACNGGAATPTSGLTLPPPQAPDTLLPSVNITDPPIDTEPIPADAMFGGDVCTALTAADIAKVFGARLTDTGLLSVDTCRFLVGTGPKQVDVRVALSSLAEFTAPELRDMSDVGPTLPTSPVTASTTDSDIPDKVAPPTPPSTETPTGTEPTTTEVIAGPPPEVEELNGVGLGVRGLSQGRFYEVYVKVDKGFFTVLAPTKADAIALAKLVVEHTTK
jgi:hypothetical protein